MSTDEGLGDRTRWLLNRSRRKARRRQACELYLKVQAVAAWSAVAGLELDPWQRRILAASFRGERSHG